VTEKLVRCEASHTTCRCPPPAVTDEGDENGEVDDEFNAIDMPSIFHVLPPAPRYAHMATSV
jgi:hypothetical protein